MGHTYDDELQQLNKGEGEMIYGDCPIIILKAMLEEGVSLLGGFPGAPVSSLTDAFEQAKEKILEPNGVFVAKNVDEKAATAMLAQSMRGPVRSAVAFKSVGLNHAADTVAHIASSGVVGGAVIFVGEDYGCSSTVVAERMLPLAKKSSIPVLEPKASIPHIYEMVKHAFHLSEQAEEPILFVIQTPVGNMKGAVRVADNKPPSISLKNLMSHSLPQEDFMPMPPASLEQEAAKVQKRLPNAVRYVRDHHINHWRKGANNVRIGFITHGYVENTLIRALERNGSIRNNDESEFPIYTLHCLYPLVEDEIIAFLDSVDEVLIVEEGFPAELEEGIRAIAQRHESRVLIRGKELFESNIYKPEIVGEGISRFLKESNKDSSTDRSWAMTINKPIHSNILNEPIDTNNIDNRQVEPINSLIVGRDPQHCTGCPIRPVHANIAIKEKQLESLPVSSSSSFAFAQEASCCILGSFPPFNQYGPMTGMGTGFASTLPHSKLSKERIIAFMGDGTYWHSGINSSIVNAIQNEQDAILFIILNFHTALTGGQGNPSTPRSKVPGKKIDDEQVREMKKSLEGVGAKWVKVIDPYKLKPAQKILDLALEEKYKGPKFIISKGECMLMKQRKLKQVKLSLLSSGHRVEDKKYVVDPYLCTGDHSCIGVNGCPSLTVLPNHPNPLRNDNPVSIDQSCVGCGLCEENAHVAKLCPSFVQVTTVTNPSWLEKLSYSLRYGFLGLSNGQ